MDDTGSIPEDFVEGTASALRRFGLVEDEGRVEEGEADHNQGATENPCPSGQSEEVNPVSSWGRGRRPGGPSESPRRRTGW
jgi:hypothetical protein